MNEQNTCPDPQGPKFSELVELTRNEVAEVQRSNPTFTKQRATDWAIEGVAEAWELSSDAERRLRAALSVTL